MNFEKLIMDTANAIHKVRRREISFPPPNGNDEGEPCFCRLCEGQIDNGYGGELTEVDGYSECFDCLIEDPEIEAELRETHPHLFID